MTFDALFNTAHADAEKLMKNEEDNNFWLTSEPVD